EGREEVVEGGRGRVRGLEPELGPLPRLVPAPPVGQERDLVRREVGQPSPPYDGRRTGRGERRQPQGGPTEPADRLGQREHAVAGEVEGPGQVVDGGVVDRRDTVVLVQELQAGVEPGDGRYDGPCQGPVGRRG